MTTVDKALSLLEHFNHDRTEIGLSEFARLSGFDKSAALRKLSALQRAGFLEQDQASRKYRLGVRFLSFARLREESFPMATVLQPIAEQLTDKVGETVHIGMLVGSSLNTIIVVDSPKSNRVHVPNGRPLPINATASGLCMLSFGDPAFVAAQLDRKFEAFNAQTLVTQDELIHTLNVFKGQGFSLSNRAYNEDVSSVAAPIFGGQGYAIGTLSIASPSSRFGKNSAAAFGRAAMDAAARATSALGFSPPSTYAALTSKAA